MIAGLPRRISSRLLDCDQVRLSVIRSIWSFGVDLCQRAEGKVKKAGGAAWHKTQNQRPLLGMVP